MIYYKKYHLYILTLFLIIHQLLLFNNACDDNFYFNLSIPNLITNHNWRIIYFTVKLLFVLEKSETSYYLKYILAMKITFHTSHIIYLRANPIFVLLNKSEYYNHAKLSLSKLSLIYLPLQFNTKSAFVLNKYSFYC